MHNLMQMNNRATALFAVSGFLVFLFGYTFKNASDSWGLLFLALLSFFSGLASL